MNNDPGLLVQLLSIITPRSIKVWVEQLRIPYTVVVGHALRASFACFLALWTNSCDPIGFQRVTEDHSRDLFNAVIAPTYRGHNDQLSVVLIGESTLHTLETSWPMPLSTHADLIEAILARKPRALMIDMLYLDLRGDAEGADYLAETLYLRHGVPVFLAVPPGVAASDLPSGGEILPQLHPSTHPDRNHVRLVSVDQVDEDNAHARIPLSQSAGRPPAALGLLLALCADTRWDSCPKEVDPARYRRDLDVFWGSTPPAYDQLPGIAPGDNWLERCRTDIPQTVVGRAFAMAVQGPGALKDTCSHIPFLTGQDVLSDAPRVDSLITGRVVFLGASLAGMADRVRPPTSEAQAGVFLHAMAFDNLLSWGPNYRGPQATLWGVDDNDVENLTIATIYLLLFLCMMVLSGLPERTHTRRASLHWKRRGLRKRPRLFWKAAYRRWSKDERNLWTRVRRKLMAFLREARQNLLPMLIGVVFATLCGVALVAMVALEFFLLGLSPTNWVGILSLLAVVAPLLAPKTEQDPKGVP